jgi:hypothetical protein
MEAAMPDILDLARKRSEAERTLTLFGMMNAYGRTPEQQVRDSAQMRLAFDAFRKANADYQAAIASMSADELSALSKGGGNAH